MREIINGVIGLLLIYCAYLIGVKGKINLIHDYHYTKVKESDSKAYCRLMAIGLLLVVLTFIIEVFNTSNNISVLIMGIVIGVSIMVITHIKYNKGIF